MSEIEESDEIDSETVQQLRQELEDSGFHLDPRVEQELDNALSEEDIVGMYSGGETNEERIPLIRDFSPDKEEWGGKTIFERGQPRAITLADNLATAFPVLTPSEPLIKEVIADYEMRLTSVEGVARDQLMRIYRAMFGAGSDESEEGVSTIRLGLSAGPNDE